MLDKLVCLRYTIMSVPFDLIILMKEQDLTTPVLLVLLGIGVCIPKVRDTLD